MKIFYQNLIPIRVIYKNYFIYVKFFCFTIIKIDSIPLFQEEQYIRKT